LGDTFYRCAQRKVEARNFDIRKNLLKYDDVANEQRRAIYGQRDEILRVESLMNSIEGMHEDVIQTMITEFIPPQTIEAQWDIAGLEQALKADFALEVPIKQWLDEDHSLEENSLRAKLVAEAQQHYRDRREKMGEPIARIVEKQLTLQILDRHWKEHLAAMDYLRQGIHLRGYAQKNPEQEYKRESFQLFQ